MPESKAAGAEGGKHKAAAHGGKEFRVDGRAVAHRDVPADIERPANDPKHSVGAGGSRTKRICELVVRRRGIPWG